MKSFNFNRLMMAMIFVIMALFGPAQQGFGQSKKYYSNTPQGKAYYELSKQKILVAFRTDVPVSEQNRILGKMKEIKPITKEMILPSPQVTMAELQPGLTESEILDVLSNLQSMDEVVYANPFLVYQDGTLQGI